MRVVENLTPYLHKTVSNKTSQQLLPSPLFDQRGILSTVHAGEVKHGNIWPASVVLCKLKIRQFATCGEVGCIIGIAVQRLIIHVCRSQQLLCISVVLQVQGEI